MTTIVLNPDQKRDDVSDATISSVAKTKVRSFWNFTKGRSEADTAQRPQNGVRLMTHIKLNPGQEEDGCQWCCRPQR